MTAAVTPGREELLDLAHSLDLCAKGHMGIASDIKAVKDAAALMRRLAAKPADEGVREATIEVADDFTEPMDVGRRVLRKQQSPEWFKHLAATEIANAIRALSTTGAPKP